MPTYTSTNTSEVWGSDPYTRFSPGETASAKYIRFLPQGVTVTSHEPLVQPWKILATVTTAPGDELDVSPWEQIIVLNFTDEPVGIVANGDSENTYYIAPGAKETLSNHQGLFGLLQVTELEGEGSVYIYGLMTAI